MWGVTIVLVKWENFKKLWIAGILGMILVIVFDAPLSKGGLYLFHHPGIEIFGLPLFYITGLYAGGIFLAHFYPWGNPKKGVLIFLIANFMFLPLEFFMIIIGLFEHVYWRFLYSFIINNIGFIVTVYSYMLIQHFLGNQKYSM